MTTTEPTPGRAATRPDGARSRARILDAAEQLLAERGYAGTGISAISRASGLPASSIYWFFQNKQDLTAAVIERSAEAWLDDLGKADLEGQPGSPLARLFGFAMDKSGATLPVFGRLAILLALELGDRDPDTLERLRKLRRRGNELVGDALEGALADLGPDLAARFGKELAPLATAFAEGGLLVAQFDDGVDPNRLGEDIEVALRAIALHRAQQETR